jgi:hypothetical protein
VRLDIEKSLPNSTRTFLSGGDISVAVLGDILYRPRLYKRGRVAVLILVMLGLLSLAAVRGMAGNCLTEYGCLATGINGSCLPLGNGFVLANGRSTTHCELTAWGWLRIALSEQAAEMLQKLGIPVSYM